MFRPTRRFAYRQVRACGLFSSMLRFLYGLYLSFPRSKRNVAGGSHFLGHSNRCGLRCVTSFAGIMDGFALSTTAGHFGILAIRASPKLV